MAQGCGSDRHVRIQEFDKAVAMELEIEHNDEAAVLEEGAILDHILDLEKVLCDVGSNARALVKEHAGGIVRREREIQLCSGKVVLEMEPYSETAALETELDHSARVVRESRLYTPTMVQEMVLYIEMVGRVKMLDIVREEQEMVLDRYTVLVTQLLDSPLDCLVELETDS